MNKSTFQSKTNRDAEYKRLCAIHGKDRVSRRSAKGQCLHPMYVADFDGPEKNDTGLGNTVYKTFFPTLYMVEVRTW